MDTKGDRGNEASHSTLESHAETKARITQANAEIKTMDEPFTDFQYPDDEIAQKENHYREAARLLIGQLNRTFHHILEPGAKHLVRLWASSFALGLTVCAGRSISDVARTLGVSPQSLSKEIDIFCKETDIPKPTKLHE